MHGRAVGRLEELGLLEARRADGLFPSSDVHVVRLMAAFEDAGISIEDVARGVAAGELSFPLFLFLPEPVEAPETYEQLVARLERSPELLRRLGGELGLPPGADDRIRAEDAEMLSPDRDDARPRDGRRALAVRAALRRDASSGSSRRGSRSSTGPCAQRVARYEGLSNEEKDAARLRTRGAVHRARREHRALAAAAAPRALGARVPRRRDRGVHGGARGRRRDTRSGRRRSPSST